MLTKQPVFGQLQDRPFAHCATLAELPDGSLLAAWFSGAYETAPDVAILAARYDRAAQTWCAPWVIAAVPDRSVGQPVLLVRPGGELWLFFVVIMDEMGDWTRAQPFWQRSTDAGSTWSQPTQVMDYPGLMFRSRPLVVSGRIILPVYDENTWESRMLISEDDGASWRLTPPLQTPTGNIHPCLVARADGRLLAYLRTGGKGGVIWRTESLDQGETWLQPTPTHLPNPNSGIDLLRLESGRLALAYNPSDRLRTPLCLALTGQGEDWQWRVTLEDAHAEFSYPTLLQTSDGRIHVVYTYRREHIHHATVSETWLREYGERL